MKKVILASKSPRRLEILNAHGIDPVVMPSNCEEKLPDEIGMEDAVRMLAEQKAKATYNEVLANGGADNPDYQDAIIIGADTIVYKNEILGKPRDYDDAFRMLAAIRNTDHYVATGVAVIDVNTGDISVLSEVTTVYCKDYSDEQIREYIENEQPFDKAGSYAIQGPFREYIDRYDGDYENVVGLPFYRIEEFF